ncbi:HD domain-containing phosphohydrolase [Pseudoduganella lutea]|uniref:HD domain-containing protein n=1 Tax=Pseudoduganella lutea TaxID=321985 RepID=A0A4P6L2G8_9BURK|nr:HD domain-containing phosphohydrolase [Pseudoduganella lutea]QBE65465.1 HD domain-containing protein [Pseudoduganella lutea]
MPRSFLSSLDHSRHARWLQRITGADQALAVCDAAGVPCWTAPGHTDLEQWLLHLNPEGFVWQTDGEGMQRHDAPDATLLYQPVMSKGRRLGWLAVRVARVDGAADAPFEWDALAEALEDIAASIGDDYVTHGELNAMADELSDRYEELHLVYAIDRQVQDMTSGEDMFGNLLESWAEHMNADVAAFIKPGDNLCVSATNLSAPIHNLDLVLVEMRGDLYRFAHSSRQPIVMNDANDPRRAYIFTDMPFKILCCPVFQDKSVVAILVLLNHAEKPDFTNSDRKLGEVLANHLSSLSRMHSMLAETSKFNQQMAAALIEAVEAKDPYTRGHSERVHHISMEIGRALRLPPRELDNLFWGSLLHDVGKIGIPDAVLCKPGRLTRDEFTFIMVHPERSYEILRHIDRLKGAVPGARHHQEKYDGTGYPHGLEGHDIPYNARIIAVADTYDSITSSRAYRAGRSHEVAMAEIARVAGTQLDPAVVDAFAGLCLAEPDWIAAFGISRDTLPETTAA